MHLIFSPHLRSRPLELEIRVYLEWKWTGILSEEIVTFFYNLAAAWKQTHNQETLTLHFLGQTFWDKHFPRENISLSCIIPKIYHLHFSFKFWGILISYFFSVVCSFLFSPIHTFISYSYSTLERLSRHTFPYLIQ